MISGQTVLESSLFVSLASLWILGSLSFVVVLVAEMNWVR